MSAALKTSLAGTVLSLEYTYPAPQQARFSGPPWAATLLVAIHPMSATPDCRILGADAQRTEGPTETAGVVRAKAEVDLVGVFGVPKGLVRYAHASFLGAVSDVVRIVG